MHYCCLVTQLCLTLCDPMDCNMAGFPVFHHLPEFAQTYVLESVMPSSHIPCHPLLLLPSVFPSIRVFSKESALHIRWPKYCSFSCSISPSNKHPGLISFRMGLVGSPYCPRDFQEFSPPQFKSIHQNVLCLFI